MTVREIATAADRSRNRRTQRHWTEAEAQQFLHANENHHLYGVWLLVLDTGARRADVSNLTWTNVDLKQATVHLTDLRTGQARTVAISDRTVTALRTTLAEQIEDSSRAGSAWRGGVSGSSGHVVVTRLGQPCRPEYLTRSFKRAQTGLDLPPIPFHGLRHTMAHIPLEQGTSPQALTE